MWTAARTAAPVPEEQKYQRLKADAHRTLVETLDPSRVERWNDERLRGEVQALAKDLARRRGVALEAPQRERLTDELLHEVFGLGPLQALAENPHVTEILCNGPDHVYVEIDGKLKLTEVKFADRAHLMRLVQRIASRVGRRVDESSPMVDARLPDGSRVNAIIPPLVAEGPVVSIRRFPADFPLDKLVALGSLPAEAAAFLKACIAARINVLVSGGTGAGKTTLLNALSAFIGKSDRIVTIEDTLELRFNEPHVVRMETRSPNMEGHGEVTARQLVRNALRMRPDRIIVGEVRGAEVVDMLQAMNTGHQGSLTTVHANDAADALHRLEMMLGMSGFNVPVPVMRSYIAGAIEVVVQVSRLAGGGRKVTRVAEVAGVRPDGHYRTRTLFQFDQTGIEGGAAVGHYKATGKSPKLLARLAAAGYPLPADLFAARTLEARPEARDGN